MLEVLTRWAGSYSAAEMVTVTYFDDEFGIEQARTDLAALWTGVSPLLHSSYTWTVDTIGREIDHITGSTQGLWSEATARTGTGGVGVDGPVANASMLLLQWRTGAYISGRELRGRSFIPGLAVGNLVGGELRPTARATATTAAQAMADAASAFVIWRRPTVSTPGQIRNVTTGTVWNELGVLRGRRA